MKLDRASIRRNAIPWAAAVLFAAMIVVHLGNVFTTETVTLITSFFSLPLRALVLLSLLDGITQLRSPSERRFWTLTLTAFSAWFVADMAFQPEGNRSLLLGIFEDGAFLLFYPILIIAAEQRPCSYHRPIKGWGSRWLCAAAAVSLLIWSYVYFVGLTVLFEPEVFLSEAPSYLFFACADFILATVFLLRATRCKGRWRVIHILLGTALLGWGITDLLDGLWMLDVRVVSYGTPWDILWPLPYFAVVAAAVYRNRSDHAAGPSSPALTSVGHALVVSAFGYTFAVAVIHLVVYLSGWLRELESHREFTVVGGLAVLLTISRTIQTRERRQRRLTREPRVLVLEDEDQQVQKMEALGRLAGGIAHDFNNLLMVLQGQIDTRFDDLVQLPDGKNFVRELQTVVHRGGDLARQLLAFGRKQVSRVQIIDPAAVIADTESLLRRTLGEHVELKIDREARVWPVAINPGQLTQVLINLSLNARAAMPEGGRLDIRVGNVAILNPEDGDARELGQFVQIEVVDNGRGMDEQTRVRVFEPFFSKSSSVDGTGLGLAVVYGIVKQHGGYVTCESTEDKGTTFRIHLPRVEWVDEAPSNPGRPAPHDPGGHETILIAEDEPAVRSVTSEYLRDAGYRILEAGDGAEALELALSFDGPIDLLLTDVVMPKIGGPELADRIVSARPNTAVLFVTGYALDLPVEDPDPTRHRVLQKPYSLVELGATIRGILDRSRG
jgi:signal transduction histidine kinase